MISSLYVANDLTALRLSAIALSSPHHSLSLLALSLYYGRS